MRDFRFLYPASFVSAERWDPNDKGYVVAFRDLPEAHTNGVTLAEAMAHAADCLDTALTVYLDRGEDIPRPSARRKGERMVAVPPITAAKAALAIALKEAGMSKADLARRLRCGHKDVRRMLDPNHPTKISALADALEVLGRAIEIKIRKAA